MNWIENCSRGYVSVLNIFTIVDVSNDFRNTFDFGRLSKWYLRGKYPVISNIATVANQAYKWKGFCNLIHAWSKINVRIASHESFTRVQFRSCTNWKKCFAMNINWRTRKNLSLSFFIISVTAFNAFRHSFKFERYLRSFRLS